MGLEENSGGIPATMLVGPTSVGNGAPYPVYMGGGQSGGNSNGNGWDSGWWIILLFILLASGNWGNNGNGNSGGGFGATPIVVNDGGGNAVQRGFDQAAVMSGITGVQSGIYGLSTQLCNCCCDMQNTVNQGFFGVQSALCDGFNGVEQSANARQMANMQTAFGMQTAMNQGFNSLSSQFADCCCENRLATADLRYTIATEECATRNQSVQNTRDIVDSQNRGTQVILDKLCQLELDGKQDRINDLERQLTMANLAASQIRQTSDIQSNIISELRACPIPAQPVYGSQPIFTCPQNNNNCGCGCGNGGF